MGKKVMEIDETQENVNVILKSGKYILIGLDIDTAKQEGAKVVLVFPGDYKPEERLASVGMILRAASEQFLLQAAEMNGANKKVSAILKPGEA